MKRKIIIAFFAALITAATASAQVLTPFSPLQLGMLDSIATQDVPKAAPGIATAIIENGEVVYQKCSGIANTSDKNYTITIGNCDSIRGLLISPTKLLVNNYLLNVKANIVKPDTLFLNADRIRRVKFVKIK